MIFGIGIDIVDISRFERFVQMNKQSLLLRLFTAHELEYCSAKKHSAQHFALRFAAKEAFLKALGTGLRHGLAWKDMEVVNDQWGKPELKLSGHALDFFYDRELTTSFLALSHDANCAVATVVLEK